METQVHPHGIIADFVNKYEQFIKPELKKGNLDGIKFMIGEVCMRSEMTKSLSLPIKKGVYERYRMAIQYIGRLIEERKVRKRALLDLVNQSDRYVAEVDLMLSEDKDYKKVREEIK